MKIWNVNMDKLNEDDLNDCETFMLIDYILAMRKKIKELQIEVKQIGHSFIQKGELLNKALDTIKAKEQECEELKNIINEAKNSKLDLKSFLVGEAIQNEYEQQLDQLKAENDLARQLINWILKFFELTDYDWQYDQNEISDLIRDCFDDKQSTIDFVTDINKDLLAKLTEIKEIAEHCVKQDICTTCDNSDKCHIEDEEIPTYDVCKLILQKISECEVGNEN